MKISRKNLFLMLVIFIEGYAVLSTEILAIRLMTPYLGNGTETIALIIASVLLPLAFGYYAGGKFRPRPRKSIRGKLLGNAAISTILLTFTLSLFAIESMLGLLLLRFETTAFTIFALLYCIFLLALPTFLLGQTIPLVSNYFSRQSLSDFAAKILFTSTMGSFMGSIFSTMILMPKIGVNNTAALTILFMTILTFCLSKEVLNKYTVTAFLALCASIIMNGNSTMKGIGVIHNNQYNTVSITGDIDRDSRVIVINGAPSSAIVRTPDGKISNAFRNIKYIDDNFIRPGQAGGPPRKFLILGAGGFGIGLNDAKNAYTFVDIDPDIKDVSEKHFLESSIGRNKDFIHDDARAFLMKARDSSYDMIFLDTFSSIRNFPEHFVTIEFFELIRKKLVPDGIVIINTIQSVNFSDMFSIRFNNTFSTVFPVMNRVPIMEYDGWTDEIKRESVIYSGYKKDIPAREIYTDNLNRSFIDKNLKDRPTGNSEDRYRSEP